VSYEIDLNDDNAAKLRAALASGYDPKAVRAWAASNGIELPARGRIPALVLERYRAAGS
jgi:hypothetical protein